MQKENASVNGKWVLKFDCYVVLKIHDKLQVKPCLKIFGFLELQ